ncbi:MAG: TetR/AcrR family transcriptional regulator [Gemmatimonadaceae bacterium]
MTLPAPLPPPNPPAARATRRPRADASERILRATAHAIVATGAVTLTMHDVAEEAGVSKGLIHYHFHDKETLLARLVEWMTRNLVARERSALTESVPRHAIDDLWAWLDGELRRGHLRVLSELAEWRGPLVRREVIESARARRATATDTVEQLFAFLGLKPRIPAGLMADVVVAFVDGLAVSTVVVPEGNPRAAYDVFWLSLLSLAE